jgi:hypothetical protein
MIIIRGPQLQGAVAPLLPFESKNISLNTTLKYYIDAGIDPSKNRFSTTLLWKYVGGQYR